MRVYDNMEDNQTAYEQLQSIMALPSSVLSSSSVVTGTNSCGGISLLLMFTVCIS